MEPRRPRAESGIEGEGLRARSRRGRIGRTWWSGRWTSVLESIGLGDRLHRGRSLARAGNVFALEIGSGEATAEVLGSRSEVHQVRIAMDPIPEESWGALVGILARRALFAARLLAGEMPRSIEEAFAEAGLSLFPSRPEEIEVGCDCTDPARPCPHAAAVFYLMAERLDEDPFHLFLFRGRGREDLLGDLKRLWAEADSGVGAGDGEPGRGENGAAASGTTAAAAPASDPAGPGETAGGAPPARRGPGGEGEENGSTTAGREFFELAAPLDELQPRIMAAPIPEALLRRLGPPPGAGHGSVAEEALHRAYRSVGAWALRLAMKDRD